MINYNYFIIVIVTHYNQKLKHYYSTYNEKRKGCANDIVFHSILYNVLQYSILILSRHNDICMLMHLSSALQ